MRWRWAGWPRSRWPARLMAGAVALVLLALVGLVVATQQGALKARERATLDEDGYTRTVQARGAVLHVVWTLQQAESGQRGYLLTDDPDYLAPYRLAMADLAEREALLDPARESPAAAAHLPVLMALVDAKLAELERTVAFAEAGRRDAALALVRTDVGAVLMDDIRARSRSMLDALESERTRLLHERATAAAEAAGAAGVSAALVVASSLLCLGLAAWNLGLARQALRAEEVARARAEESERAKSGFLAAASHDLRQPLHAINLYLATLQRLATDPAALGLVRNTQAAAGAMQRMLGGILDMARIEAGIVHPVPEEFALQTVLDGLRGAYGGLAEQNGLRLELPQTPLRLFTDPGLLGSVLGNLVSNAIKFTPAGEVRVTVREAEGGVVLGVADTGIGIPPARRAEIFEEFVSLREPRGAQEGLGLGLAIARRLALLLGGRLTVQDRPGGGSLFQLALPGVLCSPSGEAPEEAAAPPEVLDGLAVLVVDDNSHALAALADNLAAEGALVVRAASGQEALRQAAAHPGLRAAVLDLQLGDMDGIALMAALRRADGQRLPAMIVTGATDLATLNRLAACGAPWLAKPAEPAAVLRALHGLLRVEARA